MSNWMPAVTLPAIEFDGDSVVFTITRLLVDDMGVVLKNYDRGTGKLKFENYDEVTALGARLLPKYVKSITGLHKADGSEVTLEEFSGIVGEYYFVGLVGELFARLMAESVVKSSEEKKSVEQPPAPSGT